ncbi:hypothetical protein QUF80_14405 [Desulfococcaceae bacterium HSG8]|nr:hypothetical protein [Desulfococcaceae bacterium HSG8]
MRWIEICKKYKDKWVLIDDVHIDEENMNISEGTVLYHNPNKEQVYKKALELRPKKFAVEYTGDLPEDLVFML